MSVEGSHQLGIVLSLTAFIVRVTWRRNYFMLPLAKAVVKWNWIWCAGLPFMTADVWNLPKFRLTANLWPPSVRGVCRLDDWESTIAKNWRNGNIYLITANERLFLLKASSWKRIFDFAHDDTSARIAKERRNHILRNKTDPINAWSHQANNSYLAFSIFWLLIELILWIFTLELPELQPETIMIKSDVRFQQRN